MSAAAQNQVLLKKLLLLVGLMAVFCFSMVPFYRKICEVTGLNDTRDVNFAVTNSQLEATRTITLEMLAAKNQNIPISFAPVEKAIRVHPGQVSRIRYRVVNNTDQIITAQAVASYSPEVAGQYMTKLQCFCFTSQTLQPHESREMPVVFVMSRDLPKTVDVVTLAYTFFDVTTQKKGL